MLKSLIQNRVVAWIVSKVGPVPGAIQRNVNVTELVRIAVTAALFGGGATAILPALVSNVQLYVTQENLAVVSTGLAFFAELIRRLRHGRPLPSAAG